MSLYDRLTFSEVPHLSSHLVSAMISEYTRGKITRQMVIDVLEITPAEEADLDDLLARFVLPRETYNFGSFVSLPSVGTAFDTTPASKGLGFARIEADGIDGAQWQIRFRKSSGIANTLTWVLRDETSATDIFTITNAEVAGDKEVITDPLILPAPLAAGEHLLRVRVKSTSASDSPDYYGSSLIVRRVDSIALMTLADCLIAAEKQVSGYGTGTALKARLGIV